MTDELKETTGKTERMQRLLKDLGIKVKDVVYVCAASFDCYKVYPLPGTRVSAFRHIENDLSLRMGAGVRIVAMDDCVGIEVPRKDRADVLLHDCIGDDNWHKENDFSLPIILGVDLYSRLRVVDLAALPHLLVAGATKQGKTVFLRNLIMSLIWKKNPEDLKFVLIDPKGTELTPFEKLQNKYLATLPECDPEEAGGFIVTDASRAEKMLSALCLELEKRYELLQKAGTREIKSYNNKLERGKIKPEDGHYHLPYIVCICDEYADLMMGTNKSLKKNIQESIIRLAQKGRAVGIHMVISTQRPCVDVISGLIKANFPARASFRVASRVDSTVILDCPGAEKLSGSGDMLFSARLDCERIQVPYISEEEITTELQAIPVVK